MRGVEFEGDSTHGCLKDDVLRHVIFDSAQAESSSILSRPSRLTSRCTDAIGVTSFHTYTPGVVLVTPVMKYSSSYFEDDGNGLPTCATTGTYSVLMGRWTNTVNTSKGACMYIQLKINSNADWGIISRPDMQSPIDKSPSLIACRHHYCIYLRPRRMSRCD